MKKRQQEADRSTQWVQDNKLVCSGEKTKLIIIATEAIRRIRLAGVNIQITVCGKTIYESACEKVFWSHHKYKLSWHHHLHGDNRNPKQPVSGIIKELSNRVGMIAQVSRYFPIEKLRIIIDGLFISKLSYCDWTTNTTRWRTKTHSIH